MRNLCYDAGQYQHNQTSITNEKQNARYYVNRRENNQAQN